MSQMRPLLTTVVLVIAGAIGIAQQPALRVVVIEGEDAVNIIQQKTAVRPIVEVRDRNNLPVTGALVTFSIEGGKAATFGGASTLTVATNAAGQAAVSGRLEISGTDVVVSQTCVGSTSTGQFAAFSTVSGTPSSIRGNETRSETNSGPAGETIQSTHTLLFEGALSGNVVTGTVKYEQKSVSTGGGGGPVDQAATGTFSVTLIRS